MPRSLDDRVTRLEEVIAYQQQTIDDLDQVVQQLNSRVSQMRKTMGEVKTLAKDIEGLRNENVKNEKPPHYGGFGSAVK